MRDPTIDNFIALFKDACKKCFGADLRSALSETECRHFSNKVFEQTGLVIGAKSLKNYSIFVLNPADSKKEKPSTATLDTLARYVLSAPYTDELKRKTNESHYPYWFEYCNAKAREKEVSQKTTINHSGQKPAIVLRNKWIAIILSAITLAAIALLAFFTTGKKPEHFADSFTALQEDSLRMKGWFIQSKDEDWWKRRNETSSYLTLFTLQGDNWADSVHSPIIRNLLLRKINSDCFTIEVNLDKFVPARKWQQAGILLLEDTSFSAKSLRLSFAYNDFFGGYEKPAEIIVQGISSTGGKASNPEEFIHYPLFTLEPGREPLVVSNLQKSALRIEKNGNIYRFLCASGQQDNFAFKEVLAKELLFKPRYVGLFALEGFVNDTNYLPARFKYFSFSGRPCGE